MCGCIHKNNSSSYMRMPFLRFALRCFFICTDWLGVGHIFLRWSLLWPMARICVVARGIWESSPIDKMWSSVLSSVKGIQSVVGEQSLSLGKVNQPDLEIKPAPLVSLVLCSVQLDWSVKCHVLKQKEAFIPGEKASAHFLCAQCSYYWRECMRYVYVVSF